MNDFDAWHLVAVVFFGSILGFSALYAVVRWIDRTGPLNRADRRQLRTVSRGKRAMASDR